MALRDDERPALGPSARRRILERVLAAAPSPPTAPRRSSRTPFWTWLAVAGAAAGLALLVTRGGDAPVSPVTEPSPVAMAPTPAPVEETRLCLEDAGTMRFAGAEVAHAAATSLALRPGARTLVVSSGEITVDVPRAQAATLRVEAPAFSVEVFDARVIVAPTGARAERGIVRVFDVLGREVAALRAGESWQAPAPAGGAAVAAHCDGPVGAAPVAAAVAPAPPAAAASGAAKRPQGRSVAPAPVARLLEKARGALADGDAARARAWLREVAAASPSRRERAAADLLAAEALLVEGKHDEAAATYRRAARLHSGLVEAEAAAFARAQLLYERGRSIDARVALEDYLARYPEGRFNREAAERLSELRRPR